MWFGCEGKRRYINSSSNGKGPDLNMISVNIINAAELLQIIVENSFWNLFRVC